MGIFFKKQRKDGSNSFTQYLLYALGEVVLIIIGILIAVNINERQTADKNNVLRCHYLEELKFALEQDKIDVVNNLNAFKEWNPQLVEIATAITNKDLSNVDSLSYKRNALWSYVTFLQQSKSKIEELKYSPINLIPNRNLKNRVLLYQETKITFLLEHQRRFNQVNDKVEDYFLEHEIKSARDLEEDKYLHRLIGRKYLKHETMLFHYNDLLKELTEINNLIELELIEKRKEFE